MPGEEMLFNVIQIHMLRTHMIALGREFYGLIFIIMVWLGISSYFYAKIKRSF